MSDPIRVLIVDDTPDIRMLLKVALKAQGGFEPVGEAADGAEGVRLAEELRPDAVLLDLAMPVMDGLQATPEIRRVSPDTRVIILSGFSKDKLAADALEAGADAYIEKGTSPKDIGEIIRTVCEGPRPPESDARTQPEPAEEPSVASESDREAWRRTVSMAVGHVGELAEAFVSFGRVVSSRVEFDRAGFALPEDLGFRIAATCGDDDGVVPVGTLVPMPARHAEDLDRGKTITVNDTSGETTGPFDLHFVEKGLRSYAVVPVRAAGRAQAVISFASVRPDAFRHEEIDYLETAVREAAAAFHILWSLGRPDNGDRRDAGEEARREWHRIVRHDLRSPLTVISGFAETMRTAWSDLPDETKLEFVDAISRGAQAMTTLLSDMEDVDTLETRTASHDARPIKLCALVEQIAADVTKSRGRPIASKISSDVPMALADEHQQRRVLCNLLENALKFSGPDARVEVRVEASGGMIHVAVSDDGPGIPKEHQARLFEKFARLTPPDGAPHVPGSGLGLYICRTIVEAHGGRIWVESEPGAGSTFHYTIAAAPAAAA